MRVFLFICLSLLLLMGTLSGQFAHAADTAIIDLQAIDRSVNPCDDFYKYSCGAWLDKAEIPADKSSLYRQSGDLELKTEAQLNQILETYASGQYPPNADGKQIPGATKLGSLYKSCMQPMSLTQAKSAVRIKALLNDIDKISSAEDLAKVLASQHLLGIDSLFSHYATSDFNDSANVIAFFNQGGISLPEKSYYFPESERSKFILKSYEEHLAKFLSLTYKELNLPMTIVASKIKAKHILYLEKSMAKASLSLEESQDSTKLNHVMTLAQFEKLMPDFAWQTYWKSMGINPNLLKKVNVTVPIFYQNLQKELAQAQFNPVRLALIKTYLQWKLLLSTNAWISDAVHAESFEFWGKTLQGKKEMFPKWKTCTNFVADSMNESLAQAYIGLYPSVELRNKTHLMITQIKTAFGENLETLTWIDEPTKKAALVKLAKINEKLGFPDQWKNYDGLVANQDDPLLNYFNAKTFAVREDINKIGKPVDKSIWYMNAWEANAYYDPSMNEFVFPLGELLPPVLDLAASDGANFGSLGATIGHELTHGYDADGSQFDENGNIKQWWTDSVRKNFENKAQCFKDQGSKYEELPGVFVNGAQTINENLADVGGLKLSYLAYKKLASTRPSAPFLGSYNEDQQFFVAYAQSWCQKISNETLQERVKTDSHPPADFRVNAVMMNFPYFTETFNCQQGKEKMAPTKRCELW